MPSYQSHHISSSLIALKISLNVELKVDLVLTCVDLALLSQTVKTRLQLQGALARTNAVYTEGAVMAMYQMGRTEGVASLWKGVGPNMVFNFVLNGLRFGIYAGINQLVGATPEKDGASLSSWVSGTTAGGIAAGVASPFALVRTRLQARSSVASFGHEHTAKGMREAFREITREEGVRGLFMGANAQMARVAGLSMTQGPETIPLPQTLP